MGNPFGAGRHLVILSQTAVYALRATLCLAEQVPPERMRVDDIATELGVPRNYLSKILHVLARGGVLASSRGPGGGFELARPATELRLHDVVLHFDEFPDQPGCLLGRPQCSDRDPCLAHDRWKGVAMSVMAFLRDTTLAELARKNTSTPIGGHR